MEAVATEIWIAEFHHPYFGWLDYEHEFASRDAAIYWLRVNESGAYRVRVRKVQ